MIRLNNQHNAFYRKQINEMKLGASLYVLYVLYCIYILPGMPNTATPTFSVLSKWNTSGAVTKKLPSPLETRTYPHKVLPHVYEQ